MPLQYNQEQQPLVMCPDGDVPLDYNQELVLPRDGPEEDVPLDYNQERQPLVMCLDRDVHLDYIKELLVPKKWARRTCVLGL